MSPDDLRDAYRILDVPVGAPKEDIRTAYRDLLKVWHPDRHAGDPSLQHRAQERLKNINGAYEAIELAGFPSARPPRVTQPPPVPPRRRAATAPNQSKQNDAAGSSTRQPPREPGGNGAATPPRTAEPPQPASPTLSTAPTPSAALPLLGLLLIGSVALVLNSMHGNSDADHSSYRSTYSEPNPAYSAPTYEASPSRGQAGTESNTGSAKEPDRPVFTLGSTHEEVRAAQGTPSSIDRTLGESWWYGSARVEFQNGRVYAWAGSPYARLNVSLQPKDKKKATEATSRGYFTLGSSKDEVIAVQGTPDQLDRTLGETWWYAGAKVAFSDGKVYEWSNPPVFSKLKVELHPRDSAQAQAAAARGFYGPHATKDEVLAVEGTPSELDRTLGETWWYGTSRLTFANGRIYEYDSDFTRGLKLRMDDPAHAVGTIEGMTSAIKKAVDKAVDDVCDCASISCAEHIADSMLGRGMDAGAEYMKNRSATPELEAFSAEMMSNRAAIVPYFKQHDAAWFSLINARLDGCVASLRQATP